MKEVLLATARDRALSAAQQYAARGDLLSAAREYQSIVEQDPKDAQTWLLLADSLQRAGDVDAAVDRYVHAANVLFEMGQIPDALQVYRQVLNLAPERYDVHLRTGQAFEQLRRFPEAVALYEKVAGVYLRSGNTREALMLYERVADLMPREVAKRLRLAELYSRERRFDDAVQHFQIGADFLRQNGRGQEYVRVAERLLYHRPVEAVTRELVRAYLELGEPRRALMKLNELLQRQNNDPEGLELLAETFMRLEKVDKACSVVLELVKHQRDGGPEAVALCVRVLRKAIGWAPQNAKLEQALAELTPLTEPRANLVPAHDQVVQVAAADADEDEFEELDEFDEFEEIEEIEEEEDEPPPPPVQSRRHSLTQEVISDGAQAPASDEGEPDFDKQLEEVRVLLKYHLFEHALVHAQQVLAIQPKHPQGLEMAAEILAALGRNQEAADARAELAKQLIARDPTAAARQVELALALIPNHKLAISLGERLSEISGVDVGVADVQDALPPSGDPLGALDLDDDMLGPIEASESLIGRVDRSLAEDLGAGPSRPPAREHDPLAALDLDVGFEDDDEVDVRRADPSLHGELNRLVGRDDFAISYESEPGISTHEQVADDDEVSIEDRFGLGGDDEADEDEQWSPPEAAPEKPPEKPSAPKMEVIAEPQQSADDDGDYFDLTDDEEEVVAEQSAPGMPVDDDDDDDFTPEPEARVEPEPEPEREWPDLSAELEELEFYLAQGLEDDALAAFNDLTELFPGHPKLLELAPRFGVTMPVDEEQTTAVHVIEAELEEALEQGFDDTDEDGVDAAAPLLDLSPEEEDDDDFLAGIFDEAAPKQRKQREVAIQTHEVGDADASDHFDLGTAYREMGLYDKAFSEFELASEDPRWQAKALVMMGTLRRSAGDANAAAELFGRAIEAARTKDERCEANYEFAMLQLTIGDIEEAKAALMRVEPGFRDRDQKLAQIS